MNNVKSWKKNFKKTGALALATLVMCGSASFVRALDDVDHTPPANSITLNESGNDTLGKQVVTGYQTSPAVGYAANITWGAMVFVYDNGTYDPTNGRLIATSSLSEKGVQGNAIYIKDEHGVDTDNLAAGNWYGFNGGNNAIKIENLSTSSVEITATPSSESEKMAEAKFNLYVFGGADSSDFKSGESDLTKFEGTYVVHGADPDYNGGETTACYYQPDGKEIHRTFGAATFNDDGSLKQSDKDSIYLNITGKPSSALKSNTTTGEEIGTITLGFKTGDAPNTVLNAQSPSV